MQATKRGDQAKSAPLKSRVKAGLAKLGLVRRQTHYRIGRGPVPSTTLATIIESKFSWISRCFFRDRYVYIVSAVDEGDTVYIIERVEQTTYLDEAEEEYVSEDYSGLVDDARGLQRDAFSRFNRGTLGERSALTIYGFWIESSINAGPERAGIDDIYDDTSLPLSHIPFGWIPVPDAVRRFNSEQAAYAYLENINGGKVPARIRHIAWFAIGLSTILWQWHGEIVGLFRWIAGLFG